MTASRGIRVPWTTEHDDLVRDLTLTVPAIAAATGRTVSSVEHRRHTLRQRGELGYLPHLPTGSRLLVAKSCSRCHVLRDAHRYRYRPHRSLYDSWCRYCHQADILSRHDSHESRLRGQLATIKDGYPDHHGELWTGREIETLERSDLTPTEKAEALGRTRYAIGAAMRLLNAERCPQPEG